MTILRWNNDVGRYQAMVGTQRIEVDGDIYMETCRAMMKDYAKADGFSTDLDELSDDTYDTYYAKAEAVLEQAESWLQPPMDGLYIDGVPQFDE